MDFIDFHNFSSIFVDFHRFSWFIWIYIDFHCFSWIWEVLGPGVSAVRCHRENPCATLWSPVAPDWIPLILRFQILEAWIWRPGAWMLDAGRIGMDSRRWRRWRHSGERGLEGRLTRSSFRSSADYRLFCILINLCRCKSNLNLNPLKWANSFSLLTDCPINIDEHLAFNLSM